MSIRIVVREKDMKDVKEKKRFTIVCENQRVYERLKEAWETWKAYCVFADLGRPELALAMLLEGIVRAKKGEISQLTIEDVVKELEKK